MASFEEALTKITVPASGDLSSNQYSAMVINSTGQAVLASGEGGDVVGVLQNKPDAANRAASIAVGGVTKALAAGTITRGSRVTIDATGKFVAVTSGDDWSFGVALDTGASGSIFPMLIQPLGQRI